MVHFDKLEFAFYTFKLAVNKIKLNRKSVYEIPSKYWLISLKRVNN